MSNIKTPASNKNVTQNKPNVPRTEETLYGFIANSFNAGHARTIAWKRCMAGEIHKQYKMKVKIKLLTPLTPAYMPLYITFDSYYVPDSRVYTNAEKFIAQRGGSTEIKIESLPHFTQKMPVATNNEDLTIYPETNICNTTAWRDSFISCYVPRVGYNNAWDSLSLTEEEANNVMRDIPAINALLPRGRVAIWNDYERNKNYENERTEYKGDTVSTMELNSYMPNYSTHWDFLTMRAKRPNSYYTDYRTDYQGFESELPLDLEANKSLVLWANFEAKIAESRQQAENTNLTDYQILAKLRGSKLLTEGKVQHIGQFTTRLNYSAVTQNTYNMNENIQPEYQVLGQQGGYSYTEIEVPCYAGFITNEEGTIHIIATVWAPTVFESGVDRTALNVKALDQYRPELVDDKFDVLYQAELGTVNKNYYDAVGFKRRYNEYFKLPNCVAGDLTTKWYFQSKFSDNSHSITLETKTGANNAQESLVPVITQSTYQFFETNDRNELNEIGFTNTNELKKFWLDYTDLMLAKNQAIKPKIESKAEEINGPFTLGNTFMIYGQNQIDIMGESMLECVLPIDEKIKNNYTNYGEH